jgi:hypothetical protein
MLFTTIVAALTLAASASAWTIPHDTQDGVYSVETLANGTSIHTKISDAVPGDINESASDPEARDSGIAMLLEPGQKRSANEIWCGCGFTLNQQNCDSAVAALKDQLVSPLPLNR